MSFKDSSFFLRWRFRRPAWSWRASSSRPYSSRACPSWNMKRQKSFWFVFKTFARSWRLHLTFYYNLPSTCIKDHKLIQPNKCLFRSVFLIFSDCLGPSVIVFLYNQNSYIISQFSLGDRDSNSLSRALDMLGCLLFHWILHTINLGKWALHFINFSISP